MNIRKINKNDIGRISEIIVYNNRLYYYPIFKDINYSFSIFTVENVMKMFSIDNDFLDNTYVYEDDVIKGFIYVTNHEIKKLYVDSFFQGNGIGSKLIEFALDNLNANNLWVLEKNTRAIKFYQKHGFNFDQKRQYEDGTTEWIVHMKK